MSSWSLILFRVLFNFTEVISVINLLFRSWFVFFLSLFNSLVFNYRIFCFSKVLLWLDLVQLLFSCKVQCFRRSYLIKHLYATAIICSLEESNFSNSILCCRENKSINRSSRRSHKFSRLWKFFNSFWV